MSRAVLTLTQTFLSVFYCFFSPAETKHYQHLVMVHNTKAAAPSSAQVLCGAAQAESNGPNNVQRAVEVHSPLTGKGTGGVCRICVTWVSSGPVGHRRSDRNDGFARVLLQFAPCPEGLYLCVGQCQVTRDQFSVEQDECPEENLIPSLPQLQGKGMFELWACSRSLMKRREKKKHTQKNQPRAVLSQFSLLETPSFPRVKFTCSF